jgi:hypothetical protein
MTEAENKYKIVTRRNMEIAIEALESHDDFSCERAAEILKSIMADRDMDYMPPAPPEQEAPKATTKKKTK